MQYLHEVKISGIDQDLIYFWITVVFQQFNYKFAFCAVHMPRNIKSSKFEAIFFLLKREKWVI